MILRPYRRIRALEHQVATLETVRDTVYAVLCDERRLDLRDALAVVTSLHRQLTDARSEMDGFDEALRMLAEGQRKLGVGL